MPPKQLHVVLLSWIALGCVQQGTAFQTILLRSPRPSTACRSSRTYQGETAEETSFLMKPFTTASGEIVNPYRVLKVSRTAERKEIREAYRKLSKRYHPDIVRHSKVLPGRCNNIDDVEAEWERIQISYNILSERKVRMKYDRHELIDDPGAAMQRAAVGAAAAGVTTIGKGLFRMGASALDLVLGGGDKKDDNNAENKQ